MWIISALLSSVFASLTAILAKLGLKGTDSDVVTALRTGVVLLCSIVVVLVVGSFPSIVDISAMSWIFLILSGLMTGVSWVFYYKAIQLGEVSKVAPIDKSSTVISMILAFLILGEPLTVHGIFGIAFMGIATYLMLDTGKSFIRKADIRSSLGNPNLRWIVYAAISALAAASVSILGSIGIENVESNLGTLIRTTVVLIVSWGIVFVRKKTPAIKSLGSKDVLFVVLSGLATGASWLLYYSAIHDGLASVVIPIDRLSVLFVILFSWTVLKERPSVDTVEGLLSLLLGTAIMVYPVVISH